MKVIINEQIHLTEIQPSDKGRYLKLLSEKDIYDRTLNIPYPYTERDADWWIEQKQIELKRFGRPVSFAIRDTSGQLIGGAGFDGLEVGRSHQSEIGYWLGKPYWGEGIMTEVVRKLCMVAFEEFGLIRITAHIFTFNLASEKVLLKNGFEQEGYLKKHYFKNGKYFDGKLYALIK